MDLHKESGQVWDSQPGCPGEDSAYQTEHLKTRVEMAKILSAVAFPSVKKPYAEQPPPPWSSDTGRMRDREVSCKCTAQGRKGGQPCLLVH